MRSPERQHTLDLPVTRAASSPPLDAGSIFVADSDHWQPFETKGGLCWRHCRPL